MTYRRTLRTYEKDGNQPDVHCQPRKRESRQLLERAENEEDIAEQLEAEDDEVAQVQVGRLTRGVEPRRRVTEKQLFELTIGSHQKTA